MGAGDFTSDTVHWAFFHRELERCFRCRKRLRHDLRGAPFSGGWSAHHRKPKGMGGTSDPVLASIANCLVLCGTGTTGCHGWVEKHRGEALAAGLLIPRNATSPECQPAAVPAQRRDGTWWELTAVGRAVEVGEGARLDVLLGRLPSRTKGEAS